MKGALDVHQALLAGGVPHEIVRLPTRVVTADDLPRALRLDGAPRSGCVAVRCYRVSRVDGESFVAVLVQAGAVPDPAALLATLGAEALRPATGQEVQSTTRYAAALVSAVGLPPAVDVVADTALGAWDVVYTAVGEGGLALGIRLRDLLVATHAKAATLTAVPLAPSHGRFADVIELDSSGGVRQER